MKGCFSGGFGAAALERSPHPEPQVLRCSFQRGVSALLPQDCRAAALRFLEPSREPTGIAPCSVAAGPFKKVEARKFTKVEKVFRGKGEKKGRKKKTHKKKHTQTPPPPNPHALKKNKSQPHIPLPPRGGGPGRDWRRADRGRLRAGGGGGGRVPAPLLRARRRHRERHRERRGPRSCGSLRSAPPGS